MPGSSKRSKRPACRRLVVIDHHEPQDRLRPQFSDIRRVGATATLYAEYLAQGLLPMDKARREHVLAATALMHGILTDTHGLVRGGRGRLHGGALPEPATGMPTCSNRS